MTKEKLRFEDSWIIAEESEIFFSRHSWICPQNCSYLRFTQASLAKAFRLAKTGDA